MAGQPEIKNMALFCDFENVALGVREAKYPQFDIKSARAPALKGSIVVRKAYCDWERYKEFKAVMHEAAFELIEIPHVRQSGKNSADIRLVVDALDLCYTKPHVDSFVIISGDSDFSPLVAKLRENNKLVIGVGVKKSTSDLLMAACDEFIYYDDLVSPRRPERRRKTETAQKRSRRRPKDSKDRNERPSPKRATMRRGWRRSKCLWKQSKPSRPRARRSRSGVRWSSRRSSVESRVQRVLLWLSVLQPASRGSRKARVAEAQARRAVRRLHHRRP